MEKIKDNETTFLLRIDKDVKKTAENKAKKENRSLNGHILNLIEKNNLVENQQVVK